MHVNYYYYYILCVSPFKKTMSNPLVISCSVERFSNNKELSILSDFMKMYRTRTWPTSLLVLIPTRAEDVELKPWGDFSNITKDNNWLFWKIYYKISLKFQWCIFNDYIIPQYACLINNNVRHFPGYFPQVTPFSYYCHGNHHRILWIFFMSELSEVKWGKEKYCNISSLNFPCLIIFL